MTVPVVEREHSHLHPHDPHTRAHDLGWLLVGAGAVIFALAFLVLVLWQVASTPKATGFDADGVRCYRAASELSCIQTNQPPR